MYILNLLIAIGLLIVGMVCGFHDCKKAYGIPKGVKPEEGRFVLDADLIEDYDDGHFEY